MKKVAPQTAQTMQRVKVGSIGLAAVVLLIGTASALFNSASRDDAVPMAGDYANAAAINGAVPATATEPLAELGVAPGAGTAANAAAPADR